MRSRAVVRRRSPRPSPYGFDRAGAEGALLSPPPEPRETGSEKLGCELLGGGSYDLCDGGEGMVPAHGSLFQRPDELQPP